MLFFCHVLYRSIDSQHYFPEEISVETKLHYMNVRPNHYDNVYYVLTFIVDVYI